MKVVVVLDDINVKTDSDATNRRVQNNHPHKTYLKITSLAAKGPPFNCGAETMRGNVVYLRNPRSRHAVFLLVLITLCDIEPFRLFGDA